MPDTTAVAQQEALISRYLERACSINDLQWEGILVRVLRYGIDKQTGAIVGALTACAKHRSEELPGFDEEMRKVLRLAGPRTWLAVLQALASREDEQDRVTYFMVAPLYYLTLAIVVAGDKAWLEKKKGDDKEPARPSWWHHEAY